jgi:hypothetical protein
MGFISVVLSKLPVVLTPVPFSSQVRGQGSSRLQVGFSQFGRDGAQHGEGPSSHGLARLPFSLLVSQGL